MITQKESHPLQKKDIYRENLINVKESLPAIFLDRDGVLIEDCHYLSSPEKVKIELGVLELLKVAKSKNWLIIVITNQSGISRGFFNWHDYDLVNNRILDLLNTPNLIDAIYANGYLDANTKTWRKPNPDMILEANKDFNIDLQNSILIGDRFTDLQAASRAGIKKIFHVLTGHGLNERKRILNSSEISYSDQNERLIMFKENIRKTRLFLLNNLEEFPLNIL